MDKDVLDFYRSHNLPIEDIKKTAKRRGFGRALNEALIQTFYDYKDGKIKKDISIAHHFWNIAKAFSSREYEKTIVHEMKEKKELLDTIEGLEELLQIEHTRGNKFKSALWIVCSLFPAVAILVAGLLEYIYQNKFFGW